MNELLLIALLFEEIKNKKGVVNKCYFELLTPRSPVRVRPLVSIKVAQLVRAGLSLVAFYPFLIN